MGKTSVYKPIMVCSEEHYLRCCDEARKLNEAEIERIEELAIAEGKILHRFLYEAVADGKAVYQVIKVNKRTARVRWCQIDACYADYVVPQWGMEATVPLEYVEQSIRGQDALRKIFGHS